MPEPVQLTELGESQADVSQFLTYRLARLHQLLGAQAASILAKAAGLTLGQWRVLSMLASGRATSSRDVCELTRIDPAAVSRTLRSLEEQGRVTLKRDNSDRRRLHIELTPDGRAAFERALPAMRERQARLIEALTEDEIATAFRVIDKLEGVVHP